MEGRRLVGGVLRHPAAFVFELDLVAHQQGVTGEASLLPSGVLKFRIRNRRSLRESPCLQR
jgi:hypothetical protein